MISAKQQPSLSLFNACLLLATRSRTALTVLGDKTPQEKQNEPFSSSSIASCPAERQFHQVFSIYQIFQLFRSFDFSVSNDGYAWVTRASFLILYIAKEYRYLIIVS